MVALSIGYKCGNSYGAIAHGKKTELVYSFESGIRKKSLENVHSVLSNFGGGYKEFDSTSDIKEHLMTRGPVVSTSFRLKRSFFDACEYSSSFEASLIGKIHPVLIVGWMATAFGDMWLVRSIRGGKDMNIPVSMGQFSMEECVIAPLGDGSDMAWQDETKAFDTQMKGWDLSSTSIRFYFRDHRKLEKLLDLLGGSVSQAITSKSLFVLRDESKKAKSRWAYLRDVVWKKDEKRWQITCGIVHS